MPPHVVVHAHASHVVPGDLFEATIRLVASWERDERLHALFLQIRGLARSAAGSESLAPQRWQALFDAVPAHDPHKPRPVYESSSLAVTDIHLPAGSSSTYIFRARLPTRLPPSADGRLRQCAYALCATLVPPTETAAPATHVIHPVHVAAPAPDAALDTAFRGAPGPSPTPSGPAVALFRAGEAQPLRVLPATAPLEAFAAAHPTQLGVRAHEDPATDLVLLPPAPAAVGARGGEDLPSSSSLFPLTRRRERALRLHPSHLPPSALTDPLPPPPLTPLLPPGRYHIRHRGEVLGALSLFRDHHSPGEEVVGRLAVIQPGRAEDKDGKSAHPRSRLVAADVRLVCAQRRGGRTAERVVDTCSLRLGATQEAGFSLAVPPGACASYSPPPGAGAGAQPATGSDPPGSGEEGGEVEVGWTLRMRLRLGTASPDARGDVSAARYPLLRHHRPAGDGGEADNADRRGAGCEDPAMVAAQWAAAAAKQRLARMTGLDVAAAAPTTAADGQAQPRPRADSAVSDTSVQAQRVASVPPSPEAYRAAAAVAAAGVGAAATPSHSSPPTPGDSLATPPHTPVRRFAGSRTGSDHALQALRGYGRPQDAGSTPSSSSAAAATASVSSLRSESPPAVAGGAQRARPPPLAQSRAKLPRALRSAMRRVDEAVQASGQAWATNDALGCGHRRGEQLAFALPLSVVQPPVWAEEVRCAPPSDLTAEAWMEAASEALDAVDATSGERNWAEHTRAALLATAMEAASSDGDEPPIAGAPALTHLDAVAVSAARRLARTGRAVESEYAKDTPAAPCLDV